MPARKQAEKPEAEEVKQVSNEKSEETVVVSKKDLEAFLNRLESLEEENKKLFAVADKGRLYSEEERLAKQTGTPLIHTVKLTRIGSDRGPLVVAWRMIDNESYVDGNRLVEKQNIEVFFEDGNTEKMRLIDFYRRQNKQTRGEVIKRAKNEETGQTELTVRLKDGRTIDIPLSFVN